MDRIQVNTSAVLAAQFYLDETATNPTPDSATVKIVSADGTTIVDTTAATDAGVGKFTTVLPAQSQVHQLTLTWTATFGGVAQTITTRAEVVGGFYCSLAEIRAADSSLPSATYSWDELDAARAEAEDEAERIMGRSFTTRYASDARLVVGKWGHVTARWAHVTKLRKVSATYWGDTYSVALSSCRIIGDAEVYVPVPEGSLITLDYEHGTGGPPPIEVVEKGIKIRARQIAQRSLSGVSESSDTVTMTEYGVIKHSRPSASSTGQALVDAVYSSYALGWGMA